MLDEQKFINKIIRSHLLLRLLCFLFLAGFIFFIFHNEQHAYAATATLTVPPSQEVTDHEFWKIVNQLKPEPAKVVSRAGSTTIATSGVVAEVETAGKLAKFSGRLAGGVGVVATALIFPDDIGYSRYEPIYSGAAKYEYQTPDRNNPQYSSRHSFNKNDNVIQYYVRVYSATGSRKHADVYKDVPGGLGTVEMTSYERVCMKQYGCGYGNKLVSQAAPNTEGWIYFRDLENQTQVSVQINTTPIYSNARVGRTIQKFDYKGSHVVYMTYFIDATTNARSKPSPKPNPKPKHNKNSTSTELSRRKNYVDDKFSELKTAGSEVNSNFKKLNTLTKKADSQTNKAYEADNKVSNTGNKFYSSGNLNDYNKFKQQAKTADSLYTNAMSSSQAASDTYGDTAGSQKRYADASYFYTGALRSYNNLITDRTVKSKNNTVINKQNRYAGDAMTSRNKIPGGTLNMQWQYGQSAEQLRRSRNVLRAYSIYITTKKILTEKQAKVEQLNKNSIGVNSFRARSAYNSASSLYGSTNQLGNRAEFINRANKALDQLNSSIKENRKSAKYYDDYANAQISHSISETRVAKALRFSARMIQDKKQKQNFLNTAKSWDNSASSVMSSHRIVIQERDFYNAEANRLVISEKDLQDDVDKAKSDECVQQQQQANNSPGGYETPVLRGKINKSSSAIAKSMPTNKESIELLDVVRTQSNNPKAKPSDSQKCKDLEKSRQIIVEIAPKTFIEGISDRITNVKVELYGGVSCKSGNVQRTSTQGIAQFNNCSRNGFSLRLSNLQNYWDIKPIDNTRTLGARVESSQSSRIRVFTQPYKPYPSNWVREFSIAANQYWLKRHLKGVPGNDYKFGHLNTKPADYRSIFCKPGSAALKVLYENPTGEWASAPPFGAKNELCKISIASPDIVPASSRDKINTKSWACLLYVHEYGHLLGYEDITGSMRGATTKDIMFNHLLNAGEDPMIKRQLMNDTLCPEDTRVIVP